MEEDHNTSGSSAPNERPSRPKRGAIPTPKEVIEKAPQYIPESDQGCDKPPLQPDPPAQNDKE